MDLTIIIAGLLGLALYLHTFLDTYWPKNFAFFLIAIGFYSVKIGRKYQHWSITALLFTTFLSALMAFEPNIKYFKYNPVMQLAIGNHAFAASTFLLLSIFICDKLTKGMLMKLIIGFFTVLFINAVYVLFQSLVLGLSQDYLRGFLPNTSIGATMMALPIGMIWYRMLKFKELKNLIAFSIFISAVIVAGSSMGWIVTIAGITTATLMFMRITYGSIAITTVLFGLLFYAGSYVDYAWDNVSKLDRLYFWEAYKNWWVARADHWLGAGTGTFGFFGPNIQNAIKLDMKGGAWPWMHSDFLQIIFEMGIIGFIACAAFYIHCLVRCYRAKRYDFFILLVSIFAATLGNYPLRISESAFLIMLIFAYVLKGVKYEKALK